MRFSAVCCIWVSLAMAGLEVRGNTNTFPEPFNTEQSKKAYLSPAEAAAAIQLPPNFKATLFAGEPDVQQPIAFTTDDRGRLWVAESYTYADQGKFDQNLRDRIVILEDVDNDGKFDKRTVFWDQAERLTSVAIGFGGVWALCAPNLVFIPDRNGDDIPDGKPEILLDGWNYKDVQHNIVNGLMWGPDGWLYGRHGILATSALGAPGTPAKDRTQINCGIWRFHPTRKTFEVVAHGTTNPWGMDWDENGEGFFINTVIGHLWHLIPGAHYKRMYGQDLNPYAYELIDQHADHYHWDTGLKWTETRDGKGLNDTLGGGHAHSGLMIYLGHNWPDQYRNSIFTVNLHGYRLNNDLIESRGSGYVGKHGKDFARTKDIWFRAVDLTYGPDGAVYVMDWSDTGECHEADGVHRSSGRIFKIGFGTPQRPPYPDISKLPDDQLYQLLFHKNHWLARKAQRVFQERYAGGKKNEQLIDRLRGDVDRQGNVPSRLRALWTLHAINGATPELLQKYLKDGNEHVRTWAVRLLAESGNVSPAGLEDFRRSAQTDSSPKVRLALASALQRLPLNQRAPIARALLSHSEDATDHNLPNVIWVGIAPLGDSAPLQLVDLARQSKIPKVQRWIARRLAGIIEKDPKALDALVRSAAGSPSPVFHTETVQGISEALQGWREADAPQGWSQLREKVERGQDQKIQDTARNLSLIFGDESVVGEMKRAILDENADLRVRRTTLAKLIENKRSDFLPFLQSLTINKLLAPVVARGLAAYDDPNGAKALIALYPQLRAEDRPDVISALVSRTNYAQALLDAVAANTIPRQDVSAYHARQINSLKNASLNAQLSKVWGEIRTAGNEKRQLIANYKEKLTEERLKKADLSKGREIFNTACALCHKLYGEGATIGPDLTGSGRSNLDYLLENILDPGAIVAADFKMAVITLKDGRVLNGVISAQTERTLTIQSLTETTTLERTDVNNIKMSDTSLMPEGLLESLEDQQTVDLIGYLMSKEQAPLPKGTK